MSHERPRRRTEPRGPSHDVDGTRPVGVGCACRLDTATSSLSALRPACGGDFFCIRHAVAARPIKVAVGRCAATSDPERRVNAKGFAALRSDGRGAALYWHRCSRKNEPTATIWGMHLFGRMGIVSML
jgi:hypothetical protein